MIKTAIIIFIPKRQLMIQFVIKPITRFQHCNSVLISQ